LPRPPASRRVASGMVRRDPRQGARDEPGPRIQRIAEWLIRAACRRLPADVRAEQ
jgi:hypothetical protein